MSRVVSRVGWWVAPDAHGDPTVWRGSRTEPVAVVSESAVDLDLWRLVMEGLEALEAVANVRNIVNAWELEADHWEQVALQSMGGVREEAENLADRYRLCADTLRAGLPS